MVMTLDPQALQVAQETLDRLLRAEVEEQRAYLFHFSDGRISLELEWIDIRSIMQAVIASYMAYADKPAGEASTDDGDTFTRVERNPKAIEEYSAAPNVCYSVHEGGDTEDRDAPA